MKRIDTDQAKALLIEEFAATGERSDKEMMAFHSGLNYLIDYLEEGTESRLNEFIPQEVAFDEQSYRTQLHQMETEMKQLRAAYDALQAVNAQLRANRVGQLRATQKKVQEVMAIKLPKRKLVAEPGHAPRHIVVMMDTFKGSISSARAGQAVADGIGRVLPEAEVTVFPIADGGEGTVDAFLAVGGGSRRFITVHGALMEPVETSYAILSDGTACIEVASICGLTLVPTERRNPLDTTTLGVGEAIVDALNHGCRRILIGLGGSATNDVGMGALQALGYRFLDKEGAELGPGCGRLLKRIRQVDAEGLNPLVRETKFHLLCDVNNPLLGHYGAVQVFAPQKGADTPHKLRQLEEGVLHFHNITQPYTGINCSNQNFAGAAGGMAYGLRSYLGATAHNGFTFLMEYFPTLRRLGSTDLIITGEGKADRQTLMGKAPVGVLTEANMRNVPVILVAGSVADEEVLNEAGFRGIFSIIPAPMSLHQAMRPDTAEENIRRTVTQVMQTYCHTSGEVHDDNDTSI